MNASTPPVRGSRFRSNIVRIATGAMASQIIVIGSTPLLTRLFGPEAFGALAVFTAMNTVLAGLFTLKYDLSIILPTDDGEAAQLTRLTMGSSMLFAALLLVGLGVSRWWLGPTVQPYYFLLPVGVVLAAAYTCAQQWAARANDYRRFSRSQVVGAVVNVSIALAIGLAVQAPASGLVLGWVAGLAASFAYANAWQAQRPVFSWRQLLGVASAHRRFPYFVLPSWLVQTLGSSAQPFILQALFSLRDVGHYAIANRFMFVPSTLIGSAIAEAFRAEFVDRTRRGEGVSQFFRATLGKMVLMGLPVFLVLLITAPALFEFAFGADYREAGTLARYLCAGVLAQFVAQPFAYVFVATDHVRRGLAIQTATTALPLLGLVYGGLLGDVALAFCIASGASVVLSGLLIAMAYQACRSWEVQHV
ncbi:MAG: lipopolysaccharide biosynthesis protein [Roseateles sp.]|uniref:lipopolysaccharide biosynthesis protein n=1 Tax=Roseateles sp. TaxID=1971397 RepID=UPI0040365840